MKKAKALHPSYKPLHVDLFELFTALKAVLESTLQSLKAFLSARTDWFREQVITHRRWIVASLGAIILYQQLDEVQHKLHAPGMMLLEIILSVMLLVGVHSVIEILSRSVKEETRLAAILERKHRMSLQLTSIQDWNRLTEYLLTNLSGMIPLEYAALTIYEPEKKKLSLSQEWSRTVTNPAWAHNLSPKADLCKACALQRPNVLHSFHDQEYRDCPVLRAEKNVYCLPFSYAKEFIGSIFFSTQRGKPLAQDQLELLNSLGNEKAAAISNAQQHQWLLEVKMAEAVYAERAVISRDLHDTLSQDLSYLHMKLDQYVTENPSAEVSCSRTDLVKMRDAVDEAYDSVRDTLKTLRSSKSALTTLIQDRFGSLARQENIRFKFIEEGHPRALPAEVLRQVYFICREAFTNISRHAQAQNIEAGVYWDSHDVQVRIRDDGNGFDPLSVPQKGHFGLAVMQERAQAFQGKVEIESVPGAGTEIAVLIPLS